MKKTLMALALVLMVAPAWVAADQKTVEGELVDSLCFLNMGAKGEGHKACGEKCATAGFPVGIVTADGMHYGILAPASAFRGVMAAPVRIQGNVDETNHTIVAMKVEVKKDGQWVEVKLPAMPM